MRSPVVTRPLATHLPLFSLFLEEDEFLFCPIFSMPTLNCPCRPVLLTCRLVKPEAGTIMTLASFRLQKLTPMLPTSSSLQLRVKCRTPRLLFTTHSTLRLRTASSSPVTPRPMLRISLSSDPPLPSTLTTSILHPPRTSSLPRAPFMTPTGLLPLLPVVEAWPSGMTQ